MTCGIYKLVFNGTAKIYIGQSLNIESRYRDHVYFLNKNENKFQTLDNQGNKKEKSLK